MNISVVRNFTESNTYQIAAGKAPSQTEITRFVCDTLRLASGIKEINLLYNGDQSVHIGELKSSSNLLDPRLAKIQAAYNSLTDRVTKWANPEDPRLFQLFYQLVLFQANPSSVSKQIENLIGKNNIIDNNPFAKFGIICLKDELIPNPKPENVVSKNELKEMIFLRNKIISKNIFNTIEINGSKEFKQKTLEEFEKILTFPEGRELIKRLYATKKSLSITSGEKYKFRSNSLENKIINPNSDFEYMGRYDNKQAVTKSQSYLALAHELIHCLHYFEDPQAISDRGKSTDQIHPRWTNEEEYLTIGDIKNTPAISENAFRKRTFLPLRNSHKLEKFKTSIESRINNILKYRLDFDLEILLNQRPAINKDQLSMIANSKFVKTKPHTLKALINHPEFKDIESDELINECFERARKKGWEEIISLLG